MIFIKERIQSVVSESSETRRGRILKEYGELSESERLEYSNRAHVDLIRFAKEWILWVNKLQQHRMENSDRWVAATFFVTEHLKLMKVSPPSN